MSNKSNKKEGQGLILAPTSNKRANFALFQGDIGLGTFADVQQYGDSDGILNAGDAFIDRGDAFIDRGHGDVETLNFGDVNLVNTMNESIGPVGDVHRIHHGDVAPNKSAVVGAAKVAQKLTKVGITKATTAATIVQARTAATFAREGARSAGKVLEGDAVKILSPSAGLEIIQTGTLRTDARVNAGKVKWNMYQSMDRPFKRFFSPSASIAASTSFDMAGFATAQDVTYQVSIIEIKVDAAAINKQSASEIQLSIELGTDTGGAFVRTEAVYSATLRYKSAGVSPSIICILARQVDGEWYPINAPLNNSTVPADIQNVRVTLSGAPGDVATVSVIGTESDYGRNLMSSLTPF